VGGLYGYVFRRKLHTHVGLRTCVHVCVHTTECFLDYVICFLCIFVWLCVCVFVFMFEASLFCNTLGLLRMSF